MINACVEGLILMIGAAVLGFLIAWLLRRAHVDKLEAEIDGVRDEYHGMSAKLKKAERDVVEKENLRSSAELRFSNLKTDFDKFKASFGDKDAIINQLKLDLSTKNDELGKLNNIKIKFDELLPKFEHNTNIAEGLHNELSSLEKERDDAKAELNTLLAKFDAYKVDNEDITNSYAALKADYEALKAELNNSTNNDEVIKLKASLSNAEKQANDFKLKWNDLQITNGNLVKEIESLKAQVQLTNDDDLKVIENLQSGIEQLRLQNSGSTDEIIKLKADLKNAASEANDFKLKWNDLQLANGNFIKEIESLKAQLSSAVEAEPQQVVNLENEIVDLRSQNTSLQSSIEELNEQMQEMRDTDQQIIKDLEGEVAQLKVRNEELNETVNSLNDKLVEATGSNEKIIELHNQISELLSQNETLSNTVADLELKLEAASDLSSLEAEIEKLRKENDELEVKVTELEEASVEEAPSNEEEVLNRIKSKAASIDFDRIGFADGKDDLQVIKGIGPFSERKLNALGVTTYRQIANFKDEDEEMVNDAIEFFPGRVRRDDWVGQAKKLLGIELSKEEIALSRVRAKARKINYDLIGFASAKDKDDLKLIKGIGPFIEKKLNAINIFKFSQIAKFDETTIDRVNEAIEFFPGRVKRDDWKGQAAILMNEDK